MGPMLRAELPSVSMRLDGIATYVVKLQKCISHRKLCTLHFCI
jgi:hypothetical protein